MNGPISKERVYPQIDADYFLDYAVFSGALRHYTAKTLSDSFYAKGREKDLNQLLRRLFIVGLYKEEYAAYEDLGGFLLAFLQWRSGATEYPVQTILTYKTKDAKLENLFESFDISSGRMLFDRIRIEEWIPDAWHKTHPDIDPLMVLRTICEFAFVDCGRAQRESGIRAYNKLKHGLAYVPNGSKYQPNLPNAPAVIFRNIDTKANDPFILLGIPMDDAALEKRSRIIKFVQSGLRVLAAFYLCYRYPDVLAEKGVAPPEGIFNDETLQDLRGFMIGATNQDVTWV